MLQLFAGRTLASLIVPALLFAAGFAACEAYEHKVPWGLGHKLEAARADRDAWRQAQKDTAKVAAGWATSFGAAEALRKTEHQTAIAAVNASQAACDARVATARRSAVAIQSLVSKEVPVIRTIALLACCSILASCATPHVPPAG